MTRTQKLIGSSVISLLFLAITMFSMCSVRMQKLNTADSDIDLLGDSGSDSQYQDDLLNKLEILDDNTNANATTENNGPTFMLDGNSSVTASENANLADGARTADNPESFITPELLQSMQAEISDLQKIATTKDRVADSLRQTQKERDFKQAAKAGAEQTRAMTQQPLFAGKTPPVSAIRSTSETDFQTHYQDALDDFYTHRYAKSIEKFRKLLLRRDAGALADNCQYWIGESFFALGDYYQSIVEFEKVYVFANSNKNAESQLMIGIALMKVGETNQARNEFSTLMTFYQNHSATQKAKKYLEMLERV